MIGFILSGIGIYYVGFYSYILYTLFPNKLIKDIKKTKNNEYTEL